MLTVLATLVLSGTEGTPAMAAQTATVQGTISTDDPAFERPTDGGCALSGTHTRYDTISFTTDSEAGLTLSMTVTPSGFTGAAFLYQNGLVPEHPQANCWSGTTSQVATAAGEPISFSTPYSPTGLSFWTLVVTTAEEDSPGGDYGVSLSTSAGSLTLLPEPDRTPPAFPSRPADLTVEANLPGDLRAEVAYPVVTAVDNVDGPIRATCGPTTVAGTAVATCTATDRANNRGSTTFRVTVVDTTAPVVAPPDNVTVEATSPSGATVTYPAPSATDLGGIATGPTCTPASGATFPIGTTTVTCAAKDRIGNTGNASFTVTITPQPVNKADLKIAVTGPASGRAGSPVTYTVTVSNTGPAAATNLVTVLAVSGVQTTSTAPATGSGSVKIGSTTLTGARWTAGTLAPGATATYALTGKLTAKKNKHVTAVAGALSATPDPFPRTNLAAMVTKVN